MDSRTGMIGYLEAGLKVAQLRGKAIAGNIANLNTPGYRRLAAKFSEQLEKALASGKPDALAGELFRPMNTEIGADGNDVDLDMEVGEMIENSAMYKTYMRVLAKTYRQMELAMRSQL